ERWNAVKTSSDPLYKWDENSAYIQNPPFFEKLSNELDEVKPLTGRRVVGKFGDSVTTDHISPAGAIGEDTPAGKYLLENAVQAADVTSYGSTRGNHAVRMRRTFANFPIRNQISPGTDGGFTTY